MPVRKATKEETKAWLGKGLVTLGRKPVPPSAKPSTKPKQADKTGVRGPKRP